MTSPRRVAVVPALNEERTIGTLVHLARAHVDHVIVVDDGSSDRTAIVARAAGAEVLALPHNEGKGAAMRAGFAAALRAGAAVVVTIDADLQHDPSDIDAVVAPVLKGDADVSIGSRRLGAARSSIPRLRRAGQQAMASVGTARVTDTESGFRAYAASVVDGLPVHEEGYGADWAILEHLAASGARIVEVPIRVRYGARGDSKVGIARHGSALAATVIRHVRSERPLLFFGLPGTLLFVFGFLQGLWTAVHYYGTGEFWIGKAMVATLAGILGAVLLVAALVLDAIAVMLKRRPG